MTEQNSAKFVVATSVLIISAGALALCVNKFKSSRDAREDEWDDILEFWFKGDGATGWFLSEGPARDSIDDLMRRKYLALVEDCEKGTKDWWITKSQDYRSTLALIIVLDQFTRHVFRGNQTRIAQAGVKARYLTDLCIQKGYHEKARGDELSFMLMPYRHEVPVDMRKLDKILDIVDQRERRALNEKAVLSRFKRVTESRLSEARAEFEKQHSMMRRLYSDEEILEPVPEPDEQLLQRLTEDNRGPVWKVLNRYLDLHAADSPYLIVSLSGGVDSMVLMTILAKLVEVRKLNITIVAAHVDYGNRGESHAEADFVSRYSSQLGIKCHAHMIQGLLRGVTDRDEYEARSREIRFDLYKRVWKEELKAEGSPIVLFGHHEGDVVENVLSNAMKGKTLLELSGMTEQSLISGCIIRRPLLSLTKDPIFDYAHRFGVPYFKDTTPRWSTRGQVRLEVLPCLERVYGRGCQHHLARLAEQSDEAFALLSRDFFEHRVVSSTKLRQAKGLPVAFAFDLTLNMAEMPLFLWRLALRKTAHDHSVLIATDKAVKFLYDAVNLRQKEGAAPVGWFAELRRGSRGYVWDNRYLLVFRFEAEQMVPYDQTQKEDLILRIDEPPKRFGSWMVEVRISDAGEECSVDMEYLWRSLVEDPKEDFEIQYAIDPSEDGTYRLARTQQLVLSLKIDLALRGALIPVVLPNQKLRGKAQDKKATVLARWVSPS